MNIGAFVSITKLLFLQLTKSLPRLRGAAHIIHTEGVIGEKETLFLTSPIHRSTLPNNLNDSCYDYWLVNFTKMYVTTCFGFRWENLDERILNSLIEFFLFLKFCIWIKKIKIGRVKKMNSKKRENMINVFLKRKILMRHKELQEENRETATLHTAPHPT